MKTTNASNSHPPRGSVSGRLLAFGLPVLVLAGGVLLAIALIETSPKADRKPPARLARLVETRPVESGAQPTVIVAHGTVQPAREVVLYPRVAGEVMALNPQLIPGGRFEEGATLLKIDPRDFELTVRQRETDLARAEASLALEMGQQAVAEREYELLGEDISDSNRDLVLRQPQLAQARATQEAATAALDLARLNLERTTVKAPFNCSIRSRNVNVGMQVTANTPLATLTGSDEYWVELTVPVDQLRWIRIPDNDAERGSRVRLASESAREGGRFREGEVLRLLPDLEPNGRLARLLVSVSDPLALQPENAGRPGLILGDYIRAEIAGIGLTNAIALDRRLFRDGDQVWLLNSQRQLEIRPVTVAFRGREVLLVTEGLEAGEQIIVTDLPAAMEGMALRTSDDPAPESIAVAPGAEPGSPPANEANRP